MYLVLKLASKSQQKYQGSIFSHAQSRKFLYLSDSDTLTLHLTSFFYSMLFYITQYIQAPVSKLKHRDIHPFSTLVSESMYFPCKVVLFLLSRAFFEELHYLTNIIVITF